MHFSEKIKILYCPENFLTVRRETLDTGALENFEVIRSQKMLSKRESIECGLVINE